MAKQGRETAGWRAGAAIAVLLAGQGLGDAARGEVVDGSQAYASECGRCHRVDELRSAIGGMRRLYWTDERLVRHLLRHHAHDEEQARAILRFLRADAPATSP